MCGNSVRTPEYSAITSSGNWNSTAVSLYSPNDVEMSLPPRESWRLNHKWHLLGEGKRERFSTALYSKRCQRNSQYIRAICATFLYRESPVSPSRQTMALRVGQHDIRLVEIDLMITPARPGGQQVQQVNPYQLAT
ncbi:hypothetical protein RF11_07198 [Thelohanellus kitauei]|uniref:Uncharacterized protein n=1 Tax=Thelohanellus kitauei TaxID=669202 RepID=A0A0C2MJ85_THEKT|nr:hypothetical protein RF11_07198 [Thelohanellus kitauei]